MLASFDPTLTLAAAILGFLAGWLIERSHFCTMGAISDAYLFGSWRRLRAWSLAIATAIVLTHTLAAFGVLALGESGYLAPRIEPLARLAGGVLFGIGMVLAGGCVSRNLVRLGAGSLKALVVLLLLAVSAAATLFGILALPMGLTRAAVSWPLDQQTQSLGALVAATGLAEATSLDLLIALLLVAGLLAFVLKDQTFRRSRGDLVLGLGLGLLVAVGFLVTRSPAATSGAGLAMSSLTFVAPAAESLLWLMDAGAGWPAFAVPLVLGTVAGAAFSARRAGRLRLETFASRDDMIRHVVGALLMGVGGVLALGCTIGQGMSGVATLSVDSFIALAGIGLGAIAALRRLERGSWRAALGLARDATLAAPPHR